MNGTYKLHDFVVESIHDGVLEDGILYKLDGEVKTQLREIDYWYHGQYGYDLCVISIGGLFGFINRTGEYIIEPEWDDVEHTASSGLLAVCKDKKWGFINDDGHIVIEPQFDTLDFIWFNFQVEDWLEDKAAAVLVKSDKELTMTLFGRTVTPSDMTVYPMYLPAKRGNRWYRVQMGVDGKISILRNKYPKKNKDI